MSDSRFNVDDILMEISQKRKNENPAPVAAPRKSKPFESAPFQLSGMAEEPAPRKKSLDTKAPPIQRHVEKSPGIGIREDASYTRVDMPAIKHNNPAEYKDRNATMVIPAIKNDDPTLEARRQEKIKSFMSNAPIASAGHVTTSFPTIKAMIPSPMTKALEEDDEIQEDLRAQFKSKKSRIPSINLKSERKAKASKASLVSDEDHFNNEYRTTSDVQYIEDELGSNAKKLNTRLLICAISFAALLYLSLANMYPLFLLEQICPEVNMRLFLLVNMVVLLIPVIFSSTVMGSGLTALFTLKPDQDTPAALAVLAVIIHGTALIINPTSIVTYDRIAKTSGDSTFYFAAAALILLMNAVGKTFMISRIEMNFDVIKSLTSFKSEHILSNSPLATALTDGQGLDEPIIAYSKKAAFPKNFMQISFKDDSDDSISRLASPIFLLFALGLAIASVLLFDQTFMQGITTFCVVLCVASPLTNTIIRSVPLWKAANVLADEKTVIAGMESIDVFDEINAIAIDVNELYPSKAVTLRGMKTFSEGRVDEAIVDAASIMVNTHGLLKDVFLGIISNDTSLLRPITNFNQHDNMGVDAKVMGKRVSIGNRSLMEKLNISCPSRDFEAKYIKEGFDVIFLAEENAVTSLFVLEYKKSKAAQKYVDKIASKELSIIIKCFDPNITPQRVASDFDYPEEFIKIIPANISEEYAALTQSEQASKCHVLRGGNTSRLRLYGCLFQLKRSITIGTVLQLASLILGYLLVACLAFFGAINSLGFIQLMIYQVFWALAISIIPNLKKY